MKELTTDEILEIEELNKRIDNANGELVRINETIKPLVERQKELNNEISDIKYAICNIKGHRLDPMTEHYTMMYGTSYTCMDCGRYVFDKDIRDIDVMTENKQYKRVKTLYKNNIKITLL